jgi:hypothetical protein
MTITGNEVAVDNQMRRAEKQNQSLVNRLLEGAASTAEAASLVTGSVTIGCIAKTLGIAGKFTSGLGVATLAENLDHLGEATEAAISRVEKNLEAQGVRIDEIERRLNSNELFEGIKSATLQAQRTKDKKRLERMALILANGVAENDLDPESLDDMMRAAAELRDADVALLGEVCISQDSLLQQSHDTYYFTELQQVWDQFVQNLDRSKHLRYRSSLSRLESHGLIQKFRVNTFASAVPDPYALLEEGQKFFERLQEIGSDSSVRKA